MAIDIYESDLTLPCKLNLEIKELVRGILLRRVDVETGEKLLVKLRGWRGDMLEIAEHPARTEQPVSFLIERAFALMNSGSTSSA